MKIYIQNKRILAGIAAVLALLIVVVIVLVWRTAMMPPDIDVPDRFAAQFNTFTTVAAAEDFPEDLVFYDMENTARTLKDEGGKYRLINFWAVWCPPCIEEIPSLMELEEDLGRRRVNVVFVSMDFPQKAADLKEKIKSRRLPGFETYYMRDFDVWKTLAIQGLPVSFLVDRRGRILYRMEGDADWSADSTRAFFNRLLDESG